MEQTTLKIIEKEDKKLAANPMKCFKRLCTPSKTYWKLMKWKGQKQCLHNCSELKADTR